MYVVALFGQEPRYLASRLLYESYFSYLKVITKRFKILRILVRFWVMYKLGGKEYFHFLAKNWLKYCNKELIKEIKRLLERNVCLSYRALIPSQQILIECCLWDTGLGYCACSAYYILKTRKQGSGRLNDWCKIAQLVGVRDDIWVQVFWPEITSTPLNWLLS